MYLFADQVHAICCYTVFVNYVPYVLDKCKFLDCIILMENKAITLKIGVRCIF